ncbi:MAG: FixH family protein [Saprospiraceae bacterium]|nr:FixH family protein [Saprospiraceae bacterium]
MSWAYRIVLAYAGFMGMIFYFLYVAAQQDNQMMDERYYEKEQQFINVVEGARNLDAMESRISIRIIEGEVWIEFPKNSIDAIEKGSIEFLCLSDKSKDIKLSLVPNENSILIIPGSSFINAQYQLRAEWINKDTPYAFREKFYYQST